MRCLAASGFLQRVEELGCGFGFWILDLGMKKGFPEVTGNPACGAKGIPLAYWYSAVSSAFRNVGYLVGYLTWLFSLVFFRSRTHGVSRALSSPFLSSVLFSMRGRGYPRVTQGFPRGRRPLGEAVACRLPSFFTPFSRFGFLFFDFLHFGHIHVFCEEGVKMCFFLFWLFSAVFLCGQFQYRVSNR